MQWLSRSRHTAQQAARIMMKAATQSFVLHHVLPPSASGTGALHARNSIVWRDSWKASGTRRMLAGSAGEKEEAEARAFLLKLRYTPDVADGVIAALKSSGALLPTLYAMAGPWEVGGDAGLAMLAKSVEVELAARAGAKPVGFLVKVPHAGHEFECEALEGMTLRDVAENGESIGAKMLGEYIECACSGVMACSTCHVIVDPQYFHMVGPPDEAEQDMLDLAYGSCETSRLGCQIKLEPSMEGLVICVPGGANNMMDHIPFPDA